jgi:hypothetical protein
VADAKGRLMTRGWTLPVAGAGAPIGGGLFRLFHGPAWAAVMVALAPYAVLALLVVVFSVGYLAAVARFMWRVNDQESLRQLIMVSTCAVVSIMTLTVPPLPPRRPLQGAASASRSEDAGRSNARSGQAA